MTPAIVADQPNRAQSRVIPQDLESRNIHFVGVGGCGMSGLANLLLRRGTHVSGSDARGSVVLERLAALGAPITTAQNAAAIPQNADLVVASAAIPAEHPELVEARRRGLLIVKYAELLGAVMARCDGIAIAGTHGKSTTTAWLAFVLRHAGLDPSFVVGATVPQLGGGSGVGDGPHFIAEACEYDRSFHNLHPRRAVVLNIEEDHLDCYSDLDAIREAFAAFAAGLPPDGLLVLNGEDPQCRLIWPGLTAAVQTFGTRHGDTWQATDLALENGCYAFDLRHEGQTLGRVRSPLAGCHNVKNALAVAALAHDCGLSWEQIAAGLVAFRGASRRLEVRGEVNGIRVVDDYGHHPTEIRATLQAARERFSPRRLWCVFQPHQHSRTRFLLQDFAQSFRQADRTLVPDIYFVRDTQRERELVSAQDLVNEIARRGGDALYLPQFEELVELLATEARPGDVVLTLGAGNIWKVADELVQRLGGRLPD
jgi:UDP-N-acetylmuramate--alanine ligase